MCVMSCAIWPLVAGQLMKMASGRRRLPPPLPFLSRERTEHSEQRRVEVVQTNGLRLSRCITFSLPAPHQRPAPTRERPRGARGAVLLQRGAVVFQQLSRECCIGRDIPDRRACSRRRCRPGYSQFYPSPNCTVARCRQFCLADMQVTVQDPFPPPPRQEA